MLEPICPNEELDRLRGIAEQCAAKDHHIGQHTLDDIAEILGLLRKAQMEGRVLPDPNDDGLSWNQKRKAQMLARIEALGGRICTPV